MRRCTICCRCFGFEVVPQCQDVRFVAVAVVSKYVPNAEMWYLLPLLRSRLRGHCNGNKSYILALASRPKQRQQTEYLSIGAPLRDRSNGNKSYISALGHNFETKPTAPKLASSKWSTTSRPKERQQIVHLRIEAPLRGLGNRNKPHISAPGHHFETKATTTNRTP